MKSSPTTLVLTTMMLAILPATTLYSEWKIDKSVDPFTDKVVISTFTASAKNPSKIMVVRCEESKFSVFINFETYLGNLLVPIRYRLDKTKPVSDKWLASSDGMAVFASYDRHLARLLMSANTFIIEATTNKGNKQLASFNLSGSMAAIGQVMKRCNVSQLGMHKRIEGLRLDIALQLELWGPNNISIYKQILASLDKYNGPQDEVIEPTFALAVQDFYDHYIERCRAKSISGTMCTMVNVKMPKGSKPLTPPVSAVLYENASGNLKTQAGKLKLGE